MPASRETYESNVARMEKTKRRFFLSVFVQDRFAIPLAKLCIRAGVHPNVVTALGLAAALLSAYSFYVGRLRLGALMYFAAMVLDSTDGRVARGLGKSSRLGLILDTIADKSRSIVTAFALVVGTLGFTLHALLFFGLYISTPLIRAFVSARWRPPADPMELFWHSTRFAPWLEKVKVCGFYMGWERAALALVVGPLIGRPVEALVLAVLIEVSIYIAGLVRFLRREEKRPAGAH